MDIVINKDKYKRVPDNKVYTDEVDLECIRQFNLCLIQKGVIKGALMPDCHLGYTAPIGSVLATDTHIYPSWVGNDIGCGITTIPTSFKVGDIIKHQRRIHMDIKWATDVLNNKADTYFLPRKLKIDELSVVGKNVYLAESNTINQLGTLGGGNHFIEIGADVEGMVWITVHSGSRNMGAKIAKRHASLAESNMTIKELEDPKIHPSFKVGSVQGNNYFNDMIWLNKFASINRARIIERVVYSIRKFIDTGRAWDRGAIESSHNHIECTNYVYIHRKGCTQADKGGMVNIASNMRDGIYLGRGLGEYDSLYSCSHGAGRYCSRNKCKKILSLKDFVKDTKNVSCTVSHSGLDESPRAYKDIEKVLLLQSGLVNISNHIRPLINVKNNR
jgi:tRNA-splicing ligase RtcB